MPHWTAEFVEREYDNRAAVPGHPAIFARWERDSEFARRTLAGELGLAYGTDPRQRIDLFAARSPRGFLAFIHGGYWRTLDRSMFAWLAPSYVAAGVSVALVGYRLCPQVTLGEIVEDTIAATNWMFADARCRAAGAGTAPMVLTGHSAGGHLVAALFAAPRGRLAFDTALIAGGVAISGVFDLEPLLLYSANEDLRLDAAGARRWSLMQARPTIAAPLVVAAGGAETAEFQRQSREFAAAWAPQARGCLLHPGLNHFTILDAFIERGQPLHQATLALF
jgi:arylformamidase